MTDKPNPLLDANFRWLMQDGRPTPDFFQYMRGLDRVMRSVVDYANTPDDPLPTALWNEYLEVACSGEVVPLSTGTARVTFRMPYAVELGEVRASLKTAQTSGSALTVDINQNGTSILSTKITIDNGERSSKTAAAQPVLSTTSLDDDAEMTVDIDQIGDGTAIGLKIMLIGKRSAS